MNQRIDSSTTQAIKGHLAIAAERSLERATRALENREINPAEALLWVRLQQRLANMKVVNDIPVLGDLDDELRMVRRDKPLVEIFKHIDHVLADLGERLIRHATGELTTRPSPNSDMDNILAGRAAEDMLSSWQGVQAAHRQIHSMIAGRGDRHISTRGAPTIQAHRA